MQPIFDSSMFILSSHTEHSINNADVTLVIELHMHP